MLPQHSEKHETSKSENMGLREIRLGGNGDVRSIKDLWTTYRALH